MASGIPRMRQARGSGRRGRVPGSLNMLPGAPVKREGKEPTATFPVGSRSCNRDKHLDPYPDHTHWPTPLCSFSLIFGALTVVTGIIGVVLGAEASRRYKKVNPRAEPLICASSLLAAAPCLYLALILAPTTFLASYVSEGPFSDGMG